MIRMRPSRLFFFLQGKIGLVSSGTRATCTEITISAIPAIGEHTLVRLGAASLCWIVTDNRVQRL